MLFIQLRIAVTLFISTLLGSHFAFGQQKGEPANAAEAAAQKAQEAAQVDAAYQ